MAQQIVDSHGQIPQQIIIDTDALATKITNVIGTSGTLYLIDFNNLRGTHAVLKLYDAAEVAVGTTAPDWTVDAAASARVVVSIPEGFAFTNLSYATVTVPGTAGVTSPSGGSAATLRLVIR